MEYPHFHKIRALLQEAIEHILSLGHLEEFALLPVFIEAETVVQTPPATRSANLLLLSATNLRIQRAEKQTITWIIGDRDISIREMSHLVRIRLICAQIGGIINQGLDDARRR